MTDVYELLAVFLSSTGVLGGALSAVLSVMLRRAKKDAEQKRAERIAMELQRQEGEERLSQVVLALVRVTGGTEDPELKSALQAYATHLEARRALRDKILSSYTVK